MSADEPADDDGSLRLTIRLDSIRASELARLAEQLKRSLDELVKEYLEIEIEAEHGLTYGPRLR